MVPDSMPARRYRPARIRRGVAAAACPCIAAVPTAMVSTMTAEPDSQQLRDTMYGAVNLGGFSLFSGGFINYGYWPNPLPEGPISQAARTESQAELYRQVVSRLNTSGADRILELGVGIGAGAVTVATEFHPGYLSGLDRSAEQLDRARQTIAGSGVADRIELRQGSMTELPWQAASFDGIYSVEALQHVDDLTAVASEVNRVLTPGRRFSAATFFAPGDTTETGLTELLETVDNGVDVVRPVGDFTAALGAAGLTDVTATNVGEHVWEGMDRWISQTEFAATWGRNWLQAWRNGWIDYYIVTADKPHAA